jgi:hypothetical protein
MPLELNRYPGQKVKVTFQGGVIVDYLSLEIQHDVEYDMCKGAGSGVKQRVTIDEDAKIMLKAYSNATHNSATVEANTPVEAIEYESVETGNPAMLPASFWTKFPPGTWKIGSVKVSQDEKSQQWDAELTPHHLDIPATP